MRMKTVFLVNQIIASLLVATCPVLGQTWTPTSAPAKSWQALVSSADGAKLAAFSFAQVYTSTNSGVSWVSNSLPRNSYCMSAACSSDGSMVIAGMNCGGVYTSTNSGASWISNNVPFGNWAAVATSANGNKLVALCWGNPTSYFLIYTSTNSGDTWISNSVPPSLHWIWRDVASSADGTKLAAAGIQYKNNGLFGSGVIYTSTNSGATWQATAGPSTNWTSIACSADGSKLVAAGYDYDNYPNYGRVFTSVDFGRTWRIATGCGPLYEDVSVACSQDGSKMTVVGLYGGSSIYTSTDSGDTWKTNDVHAVPPLHWRSVACSGDGSRSVAAAYPGSIYTWEAATALGLTHHGTNVVLSWPALCASDGFGLQECSDLTMTNWTAVADAVVCTNGQYRVIPSPSTGNTFYRLKRP